MNPQYKRKGKTRAEILKENPDAFKKLTKKEIKELRKNKKQLSAYAIKEINRRLEIMEKKIDQMLFLTPKPLDVKGFFHKTKGNSE
jgi:hypothetical protein